MILDILKYAKKFKMKLEKLAEIKRDVVIEWTRELRNAHNL